MGFKLKVRFRGLCAFIPNVAGDRMQVLMRNLRDPDLATDLNPHLPCMQFSQKNKWDSRVPIYSFLQRPTVNTPPERSLLWFLDQDEIEIWPGGRRITANGLTVLSSFKQFVARMADINGSTGRCAKKFLRLGTWQPEINSRIIINAGEVGVWSLFKPREPFQYWPFQPVSAHAQELALIAELSMPISEDSVEFFSNGIYRITLGPQQDGEDVIVWLHNADLDEVVVRLAPTQSGVVANPDDVNHHFRPYYDLSTVPIQNSMRPIPVHPREDDGDESFFRESDKDGEPGKEVAEERARKLRAEAYSHNSGALAMSLGKIESLIARSRSTGVSPPCVPAVFASDPDV